MVFSWLVAHHGSPAACLPGSNGMSRTSACGPAVKAGNLWRWDRLQDRLDLGHWPTNPERPLVYRHTLDAASCTIPDLRDLLGGAVGQNVMYFVTGQGLGAVGGRPSRGRPADMRAETDQDDMNKSADAACRGRRHFHHWASPALTMSC